jgi:hypothetical protein
MLHLGRLRNRSLGHGLGSSCLGRSRINGRGFGPEPESSRRGRVVHHVWMVSWSISYVSMVVGYGRGSYRHAVDLVFELTCMYRNQAVGVRT